MVTIHSERPVGATAPSAPSRGRAELRRGVVLVVGAAALFLAVKPLGVLAYPYVPVITGAVFTLAAAVSGRRSPLWGAGLVVLFWGAGVNIASRVWPTASGMAMGTTSTSSHAAAATGAAAGSGSAMSGMGSSSGGMTGMGSTATHSLHHMGATAAAVASSGHTSAWAFAFPMVMLGLGGVLAAVLAQRGFAVSPLSVSFPILFIGAGEYVHGTYGSWITATFALLTLCWGAWEVSRALRRRSATGSGSTPGSPLPASS